MWSGAPLRMMDERPGWTVLEPGVPSLSLEIRFLVFADLLVCPDLDVFSGKSGHSCQVY